MSRVKCNIYDQCEGEPLSDTVGKIWHAFIIKEIINKGVTRPFVQMAVTFCADNCAQCDRCMWPVYATSALRRVGKLK